jgi:hypothetical protein
MPFEEVGRQESPEETVQMPGFSNNLAKLVLDVDGRSAEEDDSLIAFFNMAGTFRALLPYRRVYPVRGNARPRIPGLTEPLH